MTLNELNLISEKDFLTFPLNKTKDVLNLLHSMQWLDVADSNLKENHSFYGKLLDIIRFRIDYNDFDEIKTDDVQKNYLLLRVVQLYARITQYRSMVLKRDVERDIKQLVDNAQTNITNVQTNIKKAEKNIASYIGKRYKSFEKTIDEESKKAIDKIEPQLMSTVLTLMGVFSAIITIIMSVVITSTSWLNNATGASAIIAFIIPNLVTVLSIVVLLGIVFRHKEKVVVIPTKDWDSKRVVSIFLKKSKTFFVCSLVIIAIFIGVILAVTFYELKSTNKPHIRYVLSEEMYECVEVFDDKGKKVDEIIEFNFNQNNYQFEYDDNYFHNRNLYFCEEHNTLE